MPIHVRRARPTDLDVIVEFNRLLALESEGKALDLSLLVPGVRAGLLDESKIRYYVAEEDPSPLSPVLGGEGLGVRGTIVGQMGLTLEWSDWRNGWFWWIQSVYVKPEARRQGVFRMLYEHVQNAAKADPQVIGLRLYVEEENTAAQKTYERLGMINTGYFVLEKYPFS